MLEARWRFMVPRTAPHLDTAPKPPHVPRETVVAPNGRVAQSPRFTRRVGAVPLPCQSKAREPGDRRFMVGTTKSLVLFDARLLLVWCGRHHCPGAALGRVSKYKRDDYAWPFRMVLGFAWSFAAFSVLAGPFLWFGWSFARFQILLLAAWPVLTIVCCACVACKSGDRGLICEYENGAGAETGWAIYSSGRSLGAVVGGSPVFGHCPRCSISGSAHRLAVGQAVLRS